MEATREQAIEYLIKYDTASTLQKMDSFKSDNLTAYVCELLSLGKSLLGEEYNDKESIRWQVCKKFNMDYFKKYKL